MFWPGMAAQIQDTVANCHICSTHQRNNTKEPMIAHEIPTRPWSQVGADLFEISNQKYLIMVDYYSSFIEINLLSNGTTCKQIVTHCKSQFSRHGIPDTLITDNGPQFSSTTFKQFSRDYGFQHQTTSPHYPQSNGMAEKAVQTMKNLIKKAILEKTGPISGSSGISKYPHLRHIRITCTEANGQKDKNLASNHHKTPTTKTYQPTGCA